MQKLIVGIDEVGRGPIAGPVSVGIVVCRRHFSMDGIGDSKMLTARARERAYVVAQEMRAGGEIAFGVFSLSNVQIDRLGIEGAIRKLIARGLFVLAPNPSLVDVVLDGRLLAPSVYRQQTVIHGDALVPAISLASIVAKVERDRHMVQRAHTKFPAYGFDAHKGYGTLAHYSAIQKHGLTPIHRRSFLKGVVVQSAHD